MTTINVLIVDDEAGMRLGAERALRDYHCVVSDFDAELSFSIQTAENGSEAYAILERDKVDILLLDHKLPDIQGLDVLKTLNEKGSLILTIMITAYASIEVAITATRNGAFDFLAKPFTPEELRITVRKAAEHIYLNRKAQELRDERRRVRFEFISVLAHELKSPLTAVENYLFIMRDKILGESIEGYEKVIRRSLVRTEGMRRMIFDLLDLTAIESGRKKREMTKVDLCECALESVEGIRSDAEKMGIVVKTELDKEYCYRADEGEMRIVFNNLLTNAVKYNRINGQIVLSVKNRGDEIWISCSDTGIGMSEEDVSGLFKEFVRIKNEQTKEITGSGLGLSILKKIIDLYSGTVTVESELGKGTTFTVLLPLKGAVPDGRNE